MLQLSLTRPPTTGFIDEDAVTTFIDEDANVTFTDRNGLTGTQLDAATIIADGHDTKLSLANQLRRYVNVKGFGALGNGTNDDTWAIQSAVSWTTSSTSRGTLYFPSGTYRITAPIETAPTVANNNICLEGEPGTVITGNFDDFLIKYLFPGSPSSGAQRGVIERLTLINTHATGGGIRMGTVDGADIRDCIITANQGINTSIDDDTWIAFEVSIDNCHLDPGDNPTNSNGLLLGADGPVRNCTMTGFACGARHFAGQGCANLMGCSFELCTIGYAPGTIPAGTNDSVSNWVTAGCRFVNCGTGFLHPAGGGGWRLEGIHVEAAEGTIAGDPQYGIRLVTSLNAAVFGVNITGEYAVAGFAYNSADSNVRNNLFAGMGVVNTGGGAAWVLPATGTMGDVIACNTGHVITTVPSGAGNVLEGDEYNVSNSNTAVWGATYAIGGANHVKVRYNGTNWTVVGA